ncbi:hypothetical protein PI87_02665 [Ralstonia sp. A12]|uniref:hypothetical protein n=1 Tax=Ralstonia sp. A12 TaxID=1217052 RepID=UPI00057518BC|nr:hypothetical protein [Ralstonia sp. A12]KHK58664.1 hypothetical protein PI87_02665 [Ralstonia sp. A12]
MHADLRGFEYALEPLRQQRQWRLDKLLADLGSLQRDIARARAELDRLQARHREHAQAISDAIQRHFDMDVYRRGLHWLAGLRSQMLEQEAALETLLLKKEGMQKACVDAQQKLDVMERHRDDSIVDYVQAQSSRALAQADQDWIGRQGQMPAGASV